MRFLVSVLHGGRILGLDVRVDSYKGIYIARDTSSKRICVRSHTLLNRATSWSYIGIILLDSLLQGNLV